MNKAQRGSETSFPAFVHSTVDETEMTANAFRVYGHLVRRAGSNGRCFPCYQSIGDTCFRKQYAKPATRKTLAMRAVKELEELRLLSKTRRGSDGKASDRPSKSNDYRITPTGEWLQLVLGKAPQKDAETVPSIETTEAPRGDGGSPKGTPFSLTAQTAVPGCDRVFAIAQAELDRTRSEAPRSRSTQSNKWVAGTATYPDHPDKLLSQPVSNPDKSNEYVQPTFTVFEFENSFSPEEGSFPLWEEEGFEFVPNASIAARMNASKIEQSNHPVNVNKMVGPNHNPDTSKMVETIAQPEPPELQDRIQNKKRVPPPRPRKSHREAQNYAYRYGKAGWLHLPPATGTNSQARAIAVRAMQETILQDYGGYGLAAEWEYDDDTDSWRVLDHKSCGEELTMEEALSKRGRLPLQELRNYAVAFAGLDQNTFNEGLRRLYEVALEYCQEHGRLDMLDDGERWIDQSIFDDYLGEWRESA